MTVLRDQDAQNSGSQVFAIELYCRDLQLLEMLSPWMVVKRQTWIWADPLMVRLRPWRLVPLSGYAGRRGTV